MNIGNRKIRGWLATAAAGAFALGLTACQQDQPPQTLASPDPAIQPGPPESPRGATAGTAEAKMGSTVAAGAPANVESELASRVKAALAADPALKSLTVDVTALGTDVTLHGTADSTRNRDKASTIALNVQGVRSVENKMVIVRGS